MTLPAKTYLGFVACTFTWCLLIFLAPYLASISSPFAAVVYDCFQPICHQLFDRSFHIFGEKLAVCSRCSAIYVAFFLSAIAYPFVRTLSDVRVPHRNILMASLLPMLIDVGLDMAGIHDSNFLTRSLTGAAFGFVAAFFVLPAAIEGVQQLFSRRLSSSSLI